MQQPQAPIDVSHIGLPPQILQQMPQLLQIYRSQPPALMQLLQQGNPVMHAQVGGLMQRWSSGALVH